MYLELGRTVRHVEIEVDICLCWVYKWRHITSRMTQWEANLASRGVHRGVDRFSFLTAAFEREWKILIQVLHCMWCILSHYFYNLNRNLLSSVLHFSITQSFSLHGPVRKILVDCGGVWILWLRCLRSFQPQ